MLQRFEGQFLGADQAELFFQTWTPSQVRGTIVITHGLAEHSECYHALAKVLADDGWQVFAWDMRGHGRSSGKRGYVMSIDSFISDFGCFLDVIRKQKSPHPPILLGHSLGGLVTLRYLETHDCNYTALVLSSPALGLSMPVPKFKEKLAEVAVKWLPTLTMHNEIKYTDLSHLDEMIESYSRDNLRHDKISPGLFLSMRDNFPLALAAAPDVKNPVLMLLAGEDRVASTPASQDLFERLPNKKNQLIVYPESFHEIFNDRERDRVIADLKNFINPYLGA